jgi:hypothetical protein
MTPTDPGAIILIDCGLEHFVSDRVFKRKLTRAEWLRLRAALGEARPVWYVRRAA